MNEYTCCCRDYTLMGTRRGEKATWENLAERRGEGGPGRGVAILCWVARVASLIPCHLGREQKEVMNDASCRALGARINPHRNRTGPTCQGSMKVVPATLQQWNLLLHSLRSTADTAAQGCLTAALSENRPARRPAQ